MAAGMSCASYTHDGFTLRTHCVCPQPLSAVRTHSDSMLSAVDRAQAVAYLHLCSDLLALLLQLTRRTALSHLQHEQ